VDGFNDGIKGLEIGQSRTILVPPDEGYALFENLTINKTDRIKMVERMSWNEFVSKYGEVPAENKVVSDKYWEWSVQVIDLQDTNVTTLILPQNLMNKTITPYGWDSKIVAIDSLANGGDGEIVVEHKVNKDVNATWQDKDAKIIEETDETVTIRYNMSNDPLSTKNMWFHLTLVKVMVR
jgi:FKBP-type peptidyl-prolyl cis-trans isomerase 2